jgi:serine/threonine protein kinase
MFVRGQMSAAETPTAYLKPGELLAGKYRIEYVLGEGGMGIVYAAQHELLSRRVAVKVLRPSVDWNREAITCFLAEARNVSSIKSDHVAQVFDVGLLTSGLPYMAMEFLQGADLATHATRRVSPPPVGEAVDWLLEAIEAVAHAHVVGIVHGELRPSNLFLAQHQDGSTSIKVLDFGVSKAMEPTVGQVITSTSAYPVLGSPEYMSPERLLDAKRVDELTDLWALGVIAYELLTGALPFPASGVAGLLEVIRRTEPTPPRLLRPEIPAELEAVISRSLRRDPRERFATAADFGVALAPFGTSAACRALESVMRVSWASTSARRIAASAPAPTAPATVGPSVAPWSLGSGWPRAGTPPATRVTSRPRARAGAFALAMTLSFVALAAGGYWIARARSAAAAPLLAPAAPSLPLATGVAAVAPTRNPGHDVADAAEVSSSIAPAPSVPPRFF